MTDPFVGAEPAGGKRVRLFLRDGTKAVVDLSDLLWGPAFAQLTASDEEFARLSYSPEAGTVVWPGDLDIAPEPLLARARHSQHLAQHSTGVSSTDGMAHSGPARHESSGS